MRVVVIGGTGLIGGAAADALAERHEVVRVGRRGGDLTVDITSAESVDALFRAVGPFDALVSVAGEGRFGPLAELTDEDFAFALSHKLMAQVNLVRRGIAHVADGGSFTLTSGVLNVEPVPGSSIYALVNSGLEGFARAAALELPRGVRVNVVSPPWIRETLVQRGWDPAGGMPASAVAWAYVRSVEGGESGAVIDARDGSGSVMIEDGR